jgi:hypothetical protein
LTSRRAGLAGLALLALACTLLPLACGSGDQSADGGLVTERRPRASGIQLAPDERLLWGNLVVRAAGDHTVELRDAELLRADAGLRVHRLLVADGRRPQERLLVFSERAFRALPDADRWRESLHPLRGYRVEPVEGPWEPGFEGILTRDGRWRMTEIVIQFEPIGRASVQVKGGVRVEYRVGDSERHVDLPNQLSACAPSPCRPVRPEGF